MKKSILMSIQPKWVAKILNKEKTIEVRKKFPKDYVGWVYIYCTKGKPNIQQYLSLAGVGVIAEPIKPNYINGKVVARFWCDKVEKIVPYKHFTNDCDYNYHYRTYDVPYERFLDYTCLFNDELDNYLDANIGYAIHISKLEVFEKPRQLDYYGHKNCKTCIANNGCSQVKKIVDRCGGLPLERAPQSWCYMEE